MNKERAKQALKYIEEAEEARLEELENCSDGKFDVSDEDPGSDHPIFDTFYDAEGDQGILKMVNFTTRELQNLYSRSEKILRPAWTQGRGKNSLFSCFDILFITLTVCKVGGTWDNLARLFRFKTPVFQRAVTNFVRIFEMDFYVDYVMELEESFTMSYVAKRKNLFNLFNNFPYARYPTDVFFLHGNRPFCSIEDGKKYYSGKHKLYGHKIGVSVLPCGIAINCSDPSPESVADCTIFQNNISFHVKAFSKKEEERSLDMNAGNDEEIFDSWAIIMDKGYVGMDRYARCLVGKKKPQNGFLSFADSRRNKSIASDRILVENYFGRMQSLWTLIGSEWRWERPSLRVYFRFVMAMTNYHVLKNPLRHNDSVFFRKAQSRLYTIGLNAEQKRKELHSRAYKRRKTKLLADGFGNDSVNGGSEVGHGSEEVEVDALGSQKEFDSDDDSIQPTTVV